MGRRRAADEPRTLWRRVRPAAWVLGLLVLASGLAFTTRRTLDTCGACISLHVVDVSGFGTDPFRPWFEAGRSEETRLSDTCRDIFDGRCEHRWTRFSSQGGVLFFRVFTGGTLARQPLAHQYEESERFHARVVRLLKEKRLSKEDLRAACGVPALPTPADMADPEKRRLVELGVSILDGHSDEGAADAWKEALRAAPAAGAPAPPR